MSAEHKEELKYYNRYIDKLFPNGHAYDERDKVRCTNQHIAYMLNRTQSMFRWENLPDTIPVKYLELFLQTNGNVCFYHYNNNLYVFTGGLGGEPDVYYMPTLYTVSNPALNFSKSLKIGEECVLMLNDSLQIGLLPLFSRYASGLTETELSLKVANINSRVISLISALDDATRKSAEKYLNDIEDGKQGVIASNEFFEGIKAQPYGATNGNIITNLIELEQYYKASWFNELGLNANYNMKRESLNSSESQLNDDALLPLVDNMLQCRQKGAEQVNEMYGTNITVTLASAWEDNAQEIELEHEELKGGESDEATQ